MNKFERYRLERTKHWESLRSGNDVLKLLGCIQAVQQFDRIDVLRIQRNDFKKSKFFCLA